MNFDDRFKILLDPESAPNGITTPLPVHLAPFWVSHFFADFIIDRKTSSRSCRRLPFTHVECMHKPILDFVFDLNASLVT